MDNISASVLRTILYFDVFDYPVTMGEIEKFLDISVHLKQNIKAGLQKLPQIESYNGYYFLKDKKNIVVNRIERGKVSIKKFEKAAQVSRFISWVPTVQLIGVSGSLAMKNAKATDDIDLFIITQSGTLWITRLAVLVLLLITGHLRRKFDTKTKDKICANMWIDEGHMYFDKNRQNLYTAHEIVQMQTLFSRQGIDKVFLRKNIWVRKFLPHVTIDRHIDKALNKRFVYLPFEGFAKLLQRIYMRGHTTSEIITDGFLAFHPHDYGEEIMKKWKERCQIYGV